MDPHRSYPEEPEPRWFGDEQYADPQWDGGFEPRFADEGYRAPEPRGAAAGERYAEARHQDPGWSPGGSPAGPVGPRSGEPLPPLPGELPTRSGDSTLPPADLPPRMPQDPATTRENPRLPGEARDRAHPRRPPGPMPPPGPVHPPGPPAPSGLAPDGIYRARRPATALLVWAVAAVLAVPVLMLLSDALGSPASAAGVVSGVLALLALPLAAIGVYGLASGAARVPAPPAHAWSRPPLAYLVVALVLFIAAGLAAG